MLPDNILIISYSEEFIESLERFIRYNFNFNVSTIKILEPLNKEDKATLLQIFNFISSKLECAPASILRNSFAILDLGIYEFDFNLLSTNAELQNVVASMLVLTFPEIHWMILAQKENNGKFEKNKFYYPSKIKKIFEGIFSQTSPLFDPEGFRNKIRENIKNLKGEMENLKLRDKKSAAIDEEEEYAYLHSYILYKMGYQVYTITTEKEMNSLSARKDIEIVFEDIFLNFPDRNNGGLSDLEERDKNFSFLQHVKERIFVTVGHKFTEAYENNKSYIKELKISGKKVKKIFKPSSGVYNLLEQAGLLKRYWKKRKEEWKNSKPLIKKKYSGGHSAPGRMLVIAEKLIKRAENLLYEAKSVEDCIHGALLCTDAIEYLGYKTPTTTIEAISLKHQLEVKAECMFYGISYNIDMKNRFKEMEGEIETVSRWFHSSIRKKSALNAQMGILSEFVEILRDYGQYDEEIECINYFNKLRRKMIFYHEKLYLLPFMPIVAYVQSLVDSLPKFLFSIASIPLLGGIIKYFIDNKGYFLEHILQAYTCFFSLQPVESQELGGFFGIHIITLLLIVAGFIHLGIFISHLYSVLVRK